jgi:cysteine desulfuration protein SufE
VRLFSGAKSSDIVAANLSLIEKLGFAKHLSMSRANGFASMVQTIKRLAAQP